MNYLAHIADRVLGRPLLIHPSKAEVILAVLGDRIGFQSDGERWEEIEDAFKRPSANRIIAHQAGEDRGMYSVVDGVAVIPIVGSLVNRGAYIGASSGVVSYEGLASQINMAMNDPKVSSILLDIDSPGGEATGMFSLASMIMAARDKKPVCALVNDMAASAGYGIAASANEIVVSPSSITGSIGVVMLHMDQSKELEKKGRTPTLIFAGAHKVDGNPFGPLTDEVRADLQRDVDTFYDRFVETVAAGRPSLSANAIRGTEARTFIGADAVKAGLADRVGTFAETLSRLSASNHARNRRNSLMSAQNEAADIAATIDVNTVRADAAAAATARIKAILESPEAKGREAQAQNIALGTSLSAAEAVALLATFPAAAVAPSVPSIAQRGAAAFEQSETSARVDATSAWDASLTRVGARLN